MVELRWWCGCGCGGADVDRVEVEHRGMGYDIYKESNIINSSYLTILSSTSS